MATLFEKIGLVVSASLHDLVNQAIRANSVAVLDEQVRRAVESMDQLQDTLAQVIADQRIEQTKNDGLRRDIANLDRDAQTLVAAGKDTQAAILIKQKLVKTGALTRSDQALASSKSDLEKLQAAKAALQMKIDELRQTRDNVQQALTIAKSKNRVVATIDDLSNVLEEAGAAGIADWADQVKTKADVKLEMTLEKHGALIDPLADAGVSAELERMKAALKTTSAS